MFTVYAIQGAGANADKLAGVIAEMRKLGAPTIDVVDCGDHYMALEGSYRLAAAHALGLTPVLTVYGQDEELDISGYDWFHDSTWFENNCYTAGEVAGELFDAFQAVPYRFERD